MISTDDHRTGPQDFCLYGLPELDVVGNAEGEAVAYCTRSGYGTRLIPDGTITGLQVVKAPGYIAFGGASVPHSLAIDG